jgi:hypothetical protein
MIDNKAEVLELMEITKELGNGIDYFFGKNWDLKEPFWMRIDKYVDVILDLINVPSDTSIDYEHYKKEFFSRDRFYFILYDYIDGYTSYTKEEVLNMLLTLNE